MTDEHLSPQMAVGMVGLGRMGGGLSHRLAAAGWHLQVLDRDAEHTRAFAAEHEAFVASSSLPTLVQELPSPRVVWVMVPAGQATDAVIGELSELVSPDDVVVNGGNCRWTDSARYAEQLPASYLDVGVSGGVWGRQEGFCLMVGGDESGVAQAEPLFTALAAPGGYEHVGPTGAGHFVKMVHNGIEYGLMQAYAEGFHLLRDSEFDLDLHQIAGVWRHGSVVRSWLLDLLDLVFDDEADLTEIAPIVADSGEGRWTVEAAISAGVPVPVISASLFHRMTTQQDGFGDRVLAALRAQFGGHDVVRVDAGSPPVR
jgi:6-phosphogluconate dehydrogenase